MCASPQLLASPSKGYLVHRFGKPGAVEREFPKYKAGSPANFLHSHYFRTQTDRMACGKGVTGHWNLIDDVIPGE